jgi:predicted acylesterase/phospholipase RssA/CRP-like cAMP-binding protein
MAPACSDGRAPAPHADAGERAFWHAQLATQLSGLFDSAEPAALAQLEAQVERVSLRGGEVLFRRGDPGDAAYFLVSGRLRAVDDADGERTLNDIGAGESVGEMALLSNALRSATVYALRDSLLGRLSAAAFHELIERHPRVLRRITALVVERLRRLDAGGQAGRAALKTFAVVPVGAGVSLELFGRQLADALSAHGATLRIDARGARRVLGREAADALPALDPQLVQWLNQQELAYRFVVYEADPDLSEWTQCALRQTDHVVFVADARGNARPAEVERDLARRWPGPRSPRRSLVLLWPDDALPQGAGAFLERRTVDAHYHVSMTRAEDFARLARCLTGRGIGLVLGGGGARGLAHLGVLRALAEAGVPIDWAGGTSSGAILATAAARRMPPDLAHAQCREYFARLRDPTFPLISLLAGRRIRANLQRALGAVAIEDLPIPYFCVSTNLSHAGQVVHERGLLMRAVRASLSLPGVLPPVSFGDELHVDGGLVNNLPIDVMAARPEIGAVVAVDVSPDVEMRAPGGVEIDASGWSLLWQRLRPRGSRSAVPNIMSLLTRSSVVASVYWARERRAADAASLYLRIPVADFRLLDFERVDEIAQRGYEAARDPVRAWWERQQASGAEAARTKAHCQGAGEPLSATP